jgi:hypothetical protein
MRGRLGLGFAIHPYDLLARGVGHACQNARFGHRGVGLVFQHAGESNVLVTECLDQQTPGLVFSHHADGQDIHPEIGKIADGIGAAARHHHSLPMLQDQHRRLA